ncbi:MAG: toxin-antitoxin system protein [Gemmatimonadota bacterium]
MATQARISPDTHKRLTRLADLTGKTQSEVIDTALRAFERDVYLERLNDSFTALRADPDAWQEELAERAEWDAAGHVEDNG